MTCLTPQPQGSRVSPRRPSKRRSLRWGHAPRRGAEAWRAGACGRRALPDLPPRPKAGGSKIRQSYAFPRRSSLCGPRARASRARGPRRASGLAAASQPLPRTAALSRLLAATAVGALAAARGYGRVVREEGGGVSSQYGRRDETCPVSTGGRGGGGRRLQKCEAVLSDEADAAARLQTSGRTALEPRALRVAARPLARGRRPVQVHGLRGRRSGFTSAALRMPPARGHAPLHRVRAL